MSDFVYEGVPNGVIYSKGFEAIKTLDHINHISKSFVFTGAVTNQVLLSPSTENHSLVIRGITLLAQGNSGVVKLLRESGNIVLPMYVSNQNRTNTSGQLNVILEKGTDLLLTISGIQNGTEMFVGVTYFEIEG